MSKISKNPNPEKIENAEPNPIVEKDYGSLDRKRHVQPGRFQDGDYYEETKPIDPRVEASQDNYDDFSDDNLFDHRSEGFKRNSETGRGIIKKDKPVFDN